jgi:uncharacterized membrane protein YozB (DUF420 family)
MIAIADLPGVNAVLNSISAVLLSFGYFFIRRKQIRYHKLCMGSAFFMSVLFLISYLTYHYYHGATRFPGTGSVRALYFTILISHTVLAAFVPVLAAVTLVRALRGRYLRDAVPAQLLISTFSESTACPRKISAR